MNDTEINDLDLISFVDQSPIHVGSHEKDLWIALFSRNENCPAFVEDPAGTPKYVGREEIARFWDAFIESNEIKFDVHDTIVCGLTVIRDVTIIFKGQKGLTVRAPAHLRYELSQENREIQIERLIAYWEMRDLTKRILIAGISGWKTMWIQSLHLTKTLGILRVSKHFWAGLTKNLFRDHKNIFKKIIFIFNEKSDKNLSNYFSLDAKIIFPDKSKSISSNSLKDWIPSKMKIGKCIESGFSISFNFCWIECDKSQITGIGIANFSRKNKIKSINFYYGSVEGEKSQTNSPVE